MDGAPVGGIRDRQGDELAASAEPLVHWVNADEVTQSLKFQEIISSGWQELIEANYRLPLILYLPS